MLAALELALSSAVWLTITAGFAVVRHQGSTGPYTGRISLACVDRVDGFPVIDLIVRAVSPCRVKIFMSIYEIIYCRSFFRLNWIFWLDYSRRNIFFAVRVFLWIVAGGFKQLLNRRCLPILRRNMLRNLRHVRLFHRLLDFWSISTLKASLLRINEILQAWNVLMLFYFIGNVMDIKIWAVVAGRWLLNFVRIGVAVQINLWFEV